VKYMGSKDKLAKYILPIILGSRKEGQWYVEPFVGGGNMIDKVSGNRLGSDANHYVIEALKFIRDNVHHIPRSNVEFTEEHYKSLRVKESAIKGYAGFAFSYSGKWLGGWCRDSLGKRDYVAEAYRNAVKQSGGLKGVELIHSNYDSLDIPESSIIYCDPPYKDTTKYSIGFDHNRFWDWCRKQQENGHKVYISEYSAPNDFNCIWEKQVNSSLTKDTGSKKAVERLFTYG